MSQSADNADICTEHFNRLYDETFSDIRRYVAVKCTDPCYISDIIQNTYLEYYMILLKKGIGYANNDRVLIFKIAKRKVFAYYSLKEKLKMIVPIICSNDNNDEYDLLKISENENSEDEIVSSMECERLWKIISSYPADVRKIFYLFFCEELSHSEIAAELKCSLSNVKNKLYRTISEIRKKEEKHDN